MDKTIRNILICISLLVGCSSENTNKRLEISKSYDYVLDSGKKSYLTRIKNFVIYDGTSFSLLDEKGKIYIVDSFLSVRDMYDFEKELRFLVNGSIKYHIIKNGIIYFVDNEFGVIKYYSKKTKKLLKISLPFDKVYSGLTNADYGNITSFAFITDSTLFVGYSVFSKGDKRNLNRVGVLCKTNGDIIGVLDVSNEEIDNPQRISDEAYVTFYKNRFYICFRISKKVLVFDKSLVKILDKELLTDPSFYIEPTFEGPTKYKYVRMNDSPLVFTENSFFHTLNRGPKQKITIIRYDEDVNEQERFEVELGEKLSELIDFQIASTGEYLYGWNKFFPSIIKIKY
ncbi:MAG: hypothetical protein AB1394_09305 [Bacteroidota bacterium]